MNQMFEVKLGWGLLPPTRHRIVCYDAAEAERTVAGAYPGASVMAVRQLTFPPPPRIEEIRGVLAGGVRDHGGRP